MHASFNVQSIAIICCLLMLIYLLNIQFRTNSIVMRSLNNHKVPLSEQERKQATNLIL